MLVDGVPAKHPRRTLTLVRLFEAVYKHSTYSPEQIAKMLQNLANKPSYAKEQYMASLNPFVENNKARINLFLNNLCEVGDFYDTLEVGIDPTNASIVTEIGLDGSIHGTIKEGSHDSYYAE
jgi:Ras GTPase-activating-like protein IQGAP2/3